MRRREFLLSAGAAAAMPSVLAGGDAGAAGASRPSDALSAWDGETKQVSPETYWKYMSDGETHGFAALEKLEAAFDKVLREAKETVVSGATPAVWSVYNMGYIVKTRESFFSIDLVHRRDAEFAPLLDFALVTHNHGDHWRQGFYGAMDGAKKTVVSNFLDNYGAADWRKGGPDWAAAGGYTRDPGRVFEIKDVEIRTSLIDHNDYLVDFVSAFEIRIGGEFILYHTGDSGYGTEPKLGTVWGRPDLWLFFPGCGIDPAAAAKKVDAKRIAFGHMWELGHGAGHLEGPQIRRALDSVRPVCADVSPVFWGGRVV